MKILHSGCAVSTAREAYCPLLLIDRYSFPTVASCFRAHRSPRACIQQGSNTENERGKWSLARVKSISIADILKHLF